MGHILYSLSLCMCGHGVYLLSLGLHQHWYVWHCTIQGSLRSLQYMIIIYAVIDLWPVTVGWGLERGDTVEDLESKDKEFVLPMGVERKPGYGFKEGVEVRVTREWIIFLAVNWIDVRGLTGYITADVLRGSENFHHKIYHKLVLWSQEGEKNPLKLHPVFPELEILGVYLTLLILNEVVTQALMHLFFVLLVSHI